MAKVWLPLIIENCMRRYSAQHEKIKPEIAFQIMIHQAIQTHLKGIVHPKLNICWTCIHPQAIQDVNEFVSSALDRLLTNVKKSMSWCERTTWNWLFSRKESVIMDRSNRLYIKYLNDGSDSNKQLFTSQDVNWWTGVVWIIAMFLWAVWTLLWTAPIYLVSKWCNATFLQTSLCFSRMYTSR